ncbi:MAG TPA: VWA domain-containing protein [Phycicoccus sp.]|nr:VWA domain-containing protein [Phycicoccus sp.]
MTHYPFAAIVGADDLALALILTTVSPDVGGVLVRGEKGTAKSTMVRALADILPTQAVVEGCRFACDPAAPDPACPDGPHPATAPSAMRPARLVELPVGATEDRVTGSLDLGKALGAGETAFEPGLLAAAHRGLLYVDEVNLLHDHLVDLLLDAAAMGRNTVERDGVSVTHAARLVLVGTMNPEEGELRPQLLDRFGLTVEVVASRDPAQRVEVVRRRLAFDADPQGFSDAYAAEQAAVRARLSAAQARLASVDLSDWALAKIATVCAGFDVDGMRADIVTARAARAHAAWAGRPSVTRADIRVAARLALPHRRRRKPFDAPGLDEDLLDRLLGDDDLPDPDTDPTPDPDIDPDPQSPPPDPGSDDPDDEPLDEPEPTETTDTHTPPTGPDDASDHAPEPPADTTSEPHPPADVPADPEPTDPHAPAPVGVAAAAQPYRVRALTVRGVGAGAAGKRSRAITSWGRTIGATRTGPGRLHLPATLSAAAPHQRERGRTVDEGAPGRDQHEPTVRRPARVVITKDDLRHTVTQGREANLVLVAVDASGSMGARQRMREVKTAVLSLLADAYQRRDRVGVVTFRGHEATLALPPTHSVEAAAACLTDLPHGGRTPLAEGLLTAARTLELEHLRDPRRRAVLVLVTDGRATSGADAVERARWVADRWPGTGVHAVVIDCESGRLRLGLAAELAARMGAEHLPLGAVAADQLADIIRDRRAA